MRIPPGRDHGLTLLALLAMGNWVNTPSPPLDGDAPSPKGNEGQLALQSHDSPPLLLQSVNFEEACLVFEGETIDGGPQFILHATLPVEALQDGALQTASLRGSSLPLASGALLGEELSGGTISIGSITGSGPWELDAEVVLTSVAGETYHGQLQARIRG